jgi:hypothetical protein
MVGHNTYEIWGGLKLLKGIFGGKNLCTHNVQRMYRFANTGLSPDVYGRNSGLVLRGPLSPPDGTRWSWSSGSFKFKFKFKCLLYLIKYIHLYGLETQ